MFIRIVLSTLIGSVAIIASSAIAVDFTKIQNELEVMADIMKRAVKSSDECDSCSVSIKKHYLANQGAVFYLMSSGTPRFITFSDDTDAGFSVGGFDIDIAPIVSGIRTDLDDALVEAGEALEHMKIEIDEDHQSFWSWSDSLPATPQTPHSPSSLSTNKEQRDTMRKLREQRSDIRRELALLRIKARDATEDSAEELEKENQRLQKELGALDEKYEGASKEREEMQKKAALKRHEKRKELAEKRKQRNELVKTLVMNSLCEYQATLRNLPDNEYISLIFEGMEDKNRSNIYVFEKSGLDKCEPDKNKVADKALKYMI